MKKKFSLFALSLAISALLLTVCVGIFSSGGKNPILGGTGASEASYTLTLSPSVNPISGTASSGTLAAKTDAAIAASDDTIPTIAFAYDGYSASSGNFATISDSGWIKNNDALSGITSIEVTNGSSEEALLYIFWSWDKGAYAKSAVLQLDGNTTSSVGVDPLTSNNDFGGRPSYFKIEGWEGGFSLAKIVVSYRCVRESEPGVTYTLDSATNSYSLTSYISSVSSFTVPDTYQGLPVTSIGDMAFAYGTLVSITIGKNVTRIGNGAFEDSPTFTTISFAEGSQLTSIGDNAFVETGLESFPIPDSLVSLTVGPFSSYDSLSSFSCSSSVHFSVGASGHALYTDSGATFVAFAANGYNDAYLTIPDSVTSIAADAFYFGTQSSHAALKGIVVPLSVKTVGLHAFWMEDGTSIYYRGSPSDFTDTTNGKNLHASENNYYQGSGKTYYYSDTAPTDTSNKYWHFDSDGVTPVLY
jgi:hypothetical protein